MGDSLRDQVWLQLLIGLASQAVVTALCFLSGRLWKCFIKKPTPQTAGGESMAEPDLEMATRNDGENIDDPSGERARDQDAHTLVIKISSDQLMNKAPAEKVVDAGLLAMNPMMFRC